MAVRLLLSAKDVLLILLLVLDIGSPIMRYCCMSVPQRVDIKENDTCVVLEANKYAAED